MGPIQGLAIRPPHIWQARIAAPFLRLRISENVLLMGKCFTSPRGPLSSKTA